MALVTENMEAGANAGKLEPTLAEEFGCKGVAVLYAAKAAADQAWAGLGS
jgi:hypothetical protein